jgi:DNA-binding MarR family transcriptional regulator
MTATTRRGTLMLLSRLSKMAIRNTPESLIEMKTRQYVALSYIGDPAGVSQQKLAEILCMDANNIVLLLNELEAEGWIRRVRDPADRRRHIVEITEAGHAKLDHAMAQRETVEGEILHNLDHDERDTLHRLLVKAIGDER